MGGLVQPISDLIFNRVYSRVYYTTLATLLQDRVVIYVMYLLQGMGILDSLWAIAP